MHKDKGREGRTSHQGAMLNLLVGVAPLLVFVGYCVARRALAGGFGDSTTGWCVTGFVLTIPFTDFSGTRPLPCGGERR